MRLEQITYFLQVAEKRSITGAAKMLYISQPALSKQIALLEQEVGVALFERQTRGVVLTSAGKQFEKDLKNILKELDAAKKNAALAGRMQKQILNVGCFDGIYTDDFLPQFFEYFHQTRPELKLVLHRMSFRDGEAALKKNEIDVWLTLDYEWNPTPDYCEREVVRRQSAILYSGRSSWGQKEQIDICDFRGGTLVTVDQKKSPGVYRAAMRKLDYLGIVPGEVEETDNIFTVLSYLKLMDGFAILSGAVADLVRDLKKVILPDCLGVSVIAVWDRKHAEFAEWLKGYQPEIQKEHQPGG